MMIAIDIARESLGQLRYIWRETVMAEVKTKTVKPSEGVEDFGSK